MALERPLQLLGLLVILYSSVKVLLFAWLYIRPSSLHRYLKDNPESEERNWALVTGASNGLGQEFARELCHRGFNVILHGRNPQKLARVQKELNGSHPKSAIRIVISDANLSPPSAIERDIVAKVEDLRLSVLVNNVGGTAGVQSAGETYSTIDQHSMEAVDGLININTRFTSQLTRLLLPILLKRPRSLILNISSASRWGMPYISIYSGTKSYLAAWSRALTTEMEAENRNVEVLAVIVGSVQTTCNSHPLSLFHPTAETFSKATMSRVGCGKSSLSPYLPHALQSLSLSFLPESLAMRMITATMKKRKRLADAEAKKE